MPKHKAFIAIIVICLKVTSIVQKKSFIWRKGQLILSAVYACSEAGSNGQSPPMGNGHGSPSPL